MKLLARIENNEVQQVIVCESIAWAETKLGGTWIETKIDDPQEQYAGIGMGYDENAIARFATKWSQPQPGVGDDGFGYPAGSWVYHNDRLWQSVADGNVWVPGEYGWRDYTDGNVPRWVQPAGSGDAFPTNAEVMHKGRHWRSNHFANVWEPGAPGITQWDDITIKEGPQPEIPEWAPGQVVVVGDKRTYQGITYTCIQSHTTQVGWTPPVVPALWVAD